MLEDLINFRDVSTIFSILQEKQGQSRFVGGCVRNVICGLEVNDVDIATTLKPEEVESLLKSHNIKTLDVGKDHGTIIAIINSFSYEITTLRKDIDTDGRRAVVEYSNDWSEDAARRDFTINAMSYCPKENRLYDYFGGAEDLKNGMIRFVGNPADRVKEDYLRILRFFRFYAYCGRSSNMHPPSLEACSGYAHYIRSLSPERKLYEFAKILEHHNSSNTIIIMGKNGILDHLFESPVNKSVYKILSKLDDKSKLINPLIKMLAIIDTSDIAVKKVEDVLHISNEVKKYLKTVLKLSAKGVKGLRSDLYKYAHEEPEYIVDAVVYALVKEDVGDNALIRKAEKLTEHAEEFPIRGEDIIKSFKIKQGAEVGRFLDLGKDFWYKSEYSADKDQILKYLKKSKK